jgi:hypothetical protein
MNLTQGWTRFLLYPGLKNISSIFLYFLDFFIDGATTSRFPLASTAQKHARFRHTLSCGRLGDVRRKRRTLSPPATLTYGKRNEAGIFLCYWFDISVFGFAPVTMLTELAINK